MNFLVLETHFHRERDYTGEGCALLGEHGNIDLVYQADGQAEQALKEFLELLPKADAVVMGPWHRLTTTPEDWLRAEKMKVLAGTFDNRFAGWVDLRELISRGIPLIGVGRASVWERV